MSVPPTPQAAVSRPESKAASVQFKEFIDFWVANFAGQPQVAIADFATKWGAYCKQKHASLFTDTKHPVTDALLLRIVTNIIAETPTHVTGSRLKSLTLKFGPFDHLLENILAHLVEPWGYTSRLYHGCIEDSNTYFQNMPEQHFALYSSSRHPDGLTMYRKRGGGTVEKLVIKAKGCVENDKPVVQFRCRIYNVDHVETSLINVVSKLCTGYRCVQSPHWTKDWKQDAAALPPHKASYIRASTGLGWFGPADPSPSWIEQYEQKVKASSTSGTTTSHYDNNSIYQLFPLTSEQKEQERQQLAAIVNALRKSVPNNTNTNAKQ